MKKIIIFLIAGFLMFNSAITFAGKQPTVWFGAKWGYNGLAIVPRKVNKKYVTISTRVNPVVDANLFFDASGHLNVTDKAKWSGDVSIVPKGPYCGTVLGHQARLTNELSASYMNFHDTINVCVDLPNDTDNDKMLDSWEMENFGNLGQAAADDPDFDGISNLEEFYNGTNPGVPKEIFAFPPLHRYPYSNGFYAGPDVNLEWFGSTTLGRYEVEVAIWPDCEKTIYRAEVYDTNNIGDPIVHTADLGEGIGTQCAYRIRAAFTNSIGWTDWNNWRPFKVLEPLTNHTLYLENGEPLRTTYFFFWNWLSLSFNQELNVLTSYHKTSFNYATNYLHTKHNLTNDFFDLNWKTNDYLCSRDLATIRNDLGINSAMIGTSDSLFLGGITNIGNGVDLDWSYDLDYWSPRVIRDVNLCSTNNISHIKGFSFGWNNGLALSPSLITDNDPLNEIYNYLCKRYLNMEESETGILYNTLKRISMSSYYAGTLADMANTNYQALWVNYIQDYISHYTNTSKITKVNNRGKIMPVVVTVYEPRIGNIRDFGLPACNEFKSWISNRYGKINYLNKVWNTNYTSWSEISPIQGTHGIPQSCLDNPLFKWNNRKIVFNRPCDDFDEFTLERYNSNWLVIKEKLNKIKPVCLAVEYIIIEWCEHTLKTRVPYHRIGDYADLQIQRHGTSDNNRRQIAAYAEWHKTGKYVMYAGMASTIKWKYWKLHALRGIRAGGNAGIYSWNELNRADYKGAFVINIKGTNNASRYLNWIERRNNSILKNSSFEYGTGNFIPGWTSIPQSAYYRNIKRSFSGKASLMIKNSRKCAIISNPVQCSLDNSYYLIFYAFTEGISDNNFPVEIKVTVGNAKPYSFYPIYKENNNQWISLVKDYDSGELSGQVSVRFNISLPSGAKLFLDSINFVKADAVDK